MGVVSPICCCSLSIDDSKLAHAIFSVAQCYLLFFPRHHLLTYE